MTSELKLKTDLSKLNIDDLKKSKHEHESLIACLSGEKSTLNKQSSIITQQIYDIEKMLTSILQEISCREEIEEAKHIIEQDISTMEGFELLSENEISIIISNMDRTDYRNYGVTVRFNDLERICREVIETKKQSPKWVLKNMSFIQMVDIVPNTVYIYDYEDECGENFQRGGIWQLFTQSF